MLLPTCDSHLWEAEAAVPKLLVWDPLNQKDRNCTQVGGCSPPGLVSTSSLPSMFGNSEQKLAVIEIYILACLYERHKDWYII